MAKTCITCKRKLRKGEEESCETCRRFHEHSYSSKERQHVLAEYRRYSKDGK